jgi:hypothetical protein
MRYTSIQHTERNSQLLQAFVAVLLGLSLLGYVAQAKSDLVSSSLILTVIQK